MLNNMVSLNNLLLCFPSTSGHILASYVSKIPSLARLQPAINGNKFLQPPGRPFGTYMLMHILFNFIGVGGNLASILISRMTTRLSVVSSPVITDNVLDQVYSTGVLSCLQATVDKDHYCKLLAILTTVLIDNIV